MHYNEPIMKPNVYKIQITILGLVGSNQFLFFPLLLLPKNYVRVIDFHSKEWQEYDSGAPILVTKIEIKIYNTK